MKLIYRCAHCGAQNEYPVPLAVSNTWSADDVLANAVPEFELHFWIRHPCAQDLHGIAPLVAIVE